MTLNQEEIVAIRQMFYADHLTINAIAELTGRHHSAIRGAIETERFHNVRSREDKFLNYAEFIQTVFNKYPNVRQTRLIQMLKDRGADVSIHQLRRYLIKNSLFKPGHKKAFMRVKLYAGEQAQVDWAHFGSLVVGKATRKMSCFVMVLGYSRALFARFSFDQTMNSFLKFHQEAFIFFGGVPQTLVYDNLKSAVVERFGQTIRFNSQLLEFAAHYHFKPDACNVRSGHEKGRVERTIQYIRHNFFTAREFSDLEDANLQITKWAEEYGNARPWPQDHMRKIMNVWHEEIPKLMPLPAVHPETLKGVPVRSGKQPYIRFDLNDYSIPPKFVQENLNLKASQTEIRIFDQSGCEIAKHIRSWSKGIEVEDVEHLKLLLERQTTRTEATSHPVSVQDRLCALIPEASEFFSQLIARGYHLRTTARTLTRLQRTYALSDLAWAINEALKNQTPSAPAVEQLLLTSRTSNLKNLVEPVLPTHHTIQSQGDIKSHDPANYDF